MAPSKLAVRYTFDIALALFVGIFVWRHVPGTTPRYTNEIILPGSVLSFAEWPDWSKGATRSVILLASDTCGACNASGDFYKTLLRTSDRKQGTRLIVTSDKPMDRLKRWAEALELGQVRFARWSAFRGPLYPTLLLADSQGVVTNMWVGRLSDAEQAKVLALLEDPAATDSESSSGDSFAKLINHADYLGLKALGSATLVDSRPPHLFAVSHNPDSINIPMTEWSRRLWAEIADIDSVIVDCSGESRIRCPVVAQMLRFLKITHAKLLIE